MANSAALPHRLVFKHDRTRLLPVALGAGLILARHGQTAGGLENIGPVRVVTLGATDPILHDRMMLGQVELGMNILMTLEAGAWVLARIDDELAAATGADVFTAGAVARFATRPARQAGIFDMDAAVNAAGKRLELGRVAILAGVVPDEPGPRHPGRQQGGAGKLGARNDQESQAAQQAGQPSSGKSETRNPKSEMFQEAHLREWRSAPA